MGEFGALRQVSMQRAEELWRERVFALLLDSHKIDEATAGSMRAWKHSGFSVDTSVRIGAHDQAGMARLVG
jgi:predicted secreted protein